MVGIGATIMHGVSVGDDSVVGANSLVTRDLRSAIVAYGTPAVVKRERQTAEPYY
jgi:galactoside O-acetyltransferase